VVKVDARSRVRLRQVLQLSSGLRLACPAELTSMFALSGGGLPCPPGHLKAIASLNLFSALHMLLATTLRHLCGT